MATRPPGSSLRFAVLLVAFETPGEGARYLGDAG